MAGKRKLVMFLAQLLAGVLLAAIDKLSGMEFVSMQTMAIPVFVAGNFGEHMTAGRKPAHQEGAGNGG